MKFIISSSLAEVFMSEIERLASYLNRIIEGLALVSAIVIAAMAGSYIFDGYENISARVRAKMQKFQDWKDARWLRSAGYSEFGRFREGLARVKVDGLMFHIDRKGIPAYERRFDFVGDFCAELARVKVDGLMFHIDRNGKPAYQERYLAVTDFEKASREDYSRRDVAHARTKQQDYILYRDGQTIPYANAKHCDDSEFELDAA
jgi:hypothetical protein